jgi:hypothetical protein
LTLFGGGDRMTCRVEATLVLLLALPVLARGDDPKEKPATPAEEYQALVKEAQKAEQEFFKAMKEAPEEDRARVRKEKAPNFGPRFLALAEKYSSDPVAVDALVWVVNDRFSHAVGRDSLLAKALDLLLREHVRSDKLAAVCDGLTFGARPRITESFLLAVVEKSPRKEVQAAACLALAHRLRSQADLAEALKKEPEMAKRFTESYGKEYLEALQKLDVKKQHADSDKYYRLFAEQHSGAASPERLSRLCRLLGFATDKVSEEVLRSLLEKDTRPEVLGPATLSLAKVLQGRAAALTEAEAREAEKLRAESEKLLERAASKYAEVKLGFQGSVGKQAKKELYALRNLSVGKVAPNMEGEDQDGKRFKLSDYRGKVVLLDFWSQT